MRGACLVPYNQSWSELRSTATARLDEVTTADLKGWWAGERRVAASGADVGKRRQRASDEEEKVRGCDWVATITNLRVSARGIHTGEWLWTSWRFTPEGGCVGSGTTCRLSTSAERERKMRAGWGYGYGIGALAAMHAQLGFGGFGRLLFWAAEGRFGWAWDPSLGLCYVGLETIETIWLNHNILLDQGLL